MNINEIYSKDIAKIHNSVMVINSMAFNPENYIFYIVGWLRHYYHNSISRMNQDLGLHFRYSSFEEMDDAIEKHNSDHVLEIYDALPEKLKNICKKYCIYFHKEDEEKTVPAIFYMVFDKKLSRDTWLIFFSENAKEISKEGFKTGISNLGMFGLDEEVPTENLYNVGYIANSYDAYVASYHAQGKNAVMFQSSGLKIHNTKNGDTKVIFSGKKIGNIIYLESNTEAWAAISKKDKVLFHDDNIKVVINWIEKNYQQYRNVL